MANADDFRWIALALAGTTEAPHFDRVAFKVARIYATLARRARATDAQASPRYDLGGAQALTRLTTIFAPAFTWLNASTSPSAFAKILHGAANRHSSPSEI